MGVNGPPFMPLVCLSCAAADARTSSSEPEPSFRMSDSNDVRDGRTLSISSITLVDERRSQVARKRTLNNGVRELTRDRTRSMSQRAALKVAAAYVNRATLEGRRGPAEGSVLALDEEMIHVRQRHASAALLGEDRARSDLAESEWADEYFEIEYFDLGDMVEHEVLASPVLVAMSPAAAPPVKAPSAAPTTEAPGAEVPCGEAPCAEAPGAEAPRAEAPGAEAPLSDSQQSPRSVSSTHWESVRRSMRISRVSISGAAAFALLGQWRNTSTTGLDAYLKHLGTSSHASCKAAPLHCHAIASARVQVLTLMI